MRRKSRLFKLDSGTSLKRSKSRLSYYGPHILMLAITFTMFGLIVWSIWSIDTSVEIVKIIGIEDYGDNLYKIEARARGIDGSYNYRGALPDYVQKDAYISVRFGGEGISPFGTEIIEFVAPTIPPEFYLPMQLLTLATIVGTVALILALVRPLEKKRRRKR